MENCIVCISTCICVQMDAYNYATHKHSRMHTHTTIEAQAVMVTVDETGINKLIRKHYCINCVTVSHHSQHLSFCCHCVIDCTAVAIPHVTIMAFVNYLNAGKNIV